MNILEIDPDLYPDVDSHEVVVWNSIGRSKLLPMDLDLYESKWWDYRFMSSVDATDEYIRQFGIEARRVYATTIDSERAPHITVITPESVFKGLVENKSSTKAAYSALWRGRMVADSIGMPYSLFIAEAMKNRLSRWSNIKVQDKKGKWHTKLPKPSHLYHSVGVEKVAQKWEELKASRFYFADHHAYLIDNFAGLPQQIAYYNYLVARGVNAPNSVSALAYLLSDERVPIDFMRDAIASDLFSQVCESRR